MMNPPRPLSRHGIRDGVETVWASIEPPIRDSNRKCTKRVWAYGRADGYPHPERMGPPPHPGCRNRMSPGHPEWVQPVPGLRTQSSELRTQDFRTQDSGLRTQDSGLRIQDSGLRTQSSGLRTQVSELRTHDSGLGTRNSGLRSVRFFT